MSLRGKVRLWLVVFLLIVAASFPLPLANHGIVAVEGPYLSAEQHGSYLHSFARSFETGAVILLVVVLYRLMHKKKLLPLFPFRHADLMRVKLRSREFLLPIKYTSTFVDSSDRFVPSNISIRKGVDGRCSRTSLHSTRTIPNAFIENCLIPCCSVSLRESLLPLCTSGWVNSSFQARSRTSFFPP